MLLMFFREIQWTTLLIALGIMALLAVIFSVIIVIVARYMTVDDEDERISDVRKLLAGANCGGCGKAGCDDFAKALCEGKAELTQCNPTSNANKERIAELLQMEFSSSESKMAVVHCQGGNKCKDKFEYQGFGDCVNQIMLSGGRKQCPVGCMGMDTCVKTCPENAINQIDGRALVNPKDCVSCGACVVACPKHLISLIPRSAKVYIACASHCKGKEVMDACTVGCIGCGLCAKNCPSSAITMEDNLPVIDYSKCIGCGKCADVCPRKTIVKL